MLVLNTSFGTLSDWVGIIAGVLLLISFIFKNVKTIRIINLAAAVAFIVYGILLMPNGLPLIITNSILVCIHIYYLIMIFIKESKQSEKEE